MTTKKRLIDRIIQNRILLHILFWLSCFSIFTIAAALSPNNFKESIIRLLMFSPSCLLAGYLLTYYQVPKFLLKKKYLQFAISLFLSIYVFSVIARLGIVYIAEPYYLEDFYQESFLEILTDPIVIAIGYFPRVYGLVFIMLIIKVIKDSFEEKHRLQVIQREKINTELKFLKAQIHPHFLFNTLNNLYSLTLIKSDTAPEVVLKLSEMLDYMLYQCNEPTVLIHKEVKLLQGYIDLETLRYGNKLDILFSHAYDDPNIKIAPLILLSFVENAFKHGASGNVVNPTITINLEIKENQLYFKVFNTKPIATISEITAIEKKGIGYENAKRQLELNYKNRYDLTINETDEEYEVELKITLI